MLPMYIEARSTYYVKRITQNMKSEDRKNDVVTIKIPKIKHLL